jgi:hypothetical protein
MLFGNAADGLGGLRQRFLMLFGNAADGLERSPSCACAFI